MKNLVVSLFTFVVLSFPALVVAEQHKSHIGCTKEILANGAVAYRSEAIYEHPQPKMAAITSGPAALSIPVYHSNPDASQKVYLNFEGCDEDRWNGFTAWTPPYDIDGDTSTFSADELEKIEEIWKRVSEDYAPFDIDITTEHPGSFNNRQALEACIGGSPYDWFGSAAGGFTFVNSFSNGYSNRLFVWPALIGSDDAKNIAEAASHEVGHAFGLQHQSEWVDDTKVDEYYKGFGSGETGWAPIMGNAYSKNWSTFANSRAKHGGMQDDVSVIARITNEITYRPDDHGNTNATATKLTPDSNYRVASNGLIEQMSDVDVFEFYTEAGDITLTVDNFSPGPNLNVKIELRDASNEVVATGDPEDDLDASISASVSAGTYYLHVMSGPVTIQTSVGQYTLDGTLIAPTGAPESALVSVSDVTQTGTTYRDIQVRLTDSDSLDVSTIGTGNILVTGPNGFSQVATFISIPNQNNPTSMTAIYRVSSNWDALDNGVYDINLVDGEVRDNLNNPFPADYLGSFSVELRPTPPASIFAGVDASVSHVDINWSAVSESTGYSIYRSTLFGSNGSKIADVANVTTYRDTSAQAGISYYYSVKAKNAFGAGEASSQTLGRRATDTSPSVATLIYTQHITAENLNESEIRVRFTDGDGVDASTIGAGDLAIVGPNSFTQVATFVSSDTSNATEMVGYYKALAPNAAWTDADNGQYDIYLVANQVVDTVSNAFTFKKLGSFLVQLAPRALQQVSASVDSSIDHIDLSWAAVTGATGYAVYRSTSSTNFGSVIANIGAVTSFRDTNAQTALNYYYSVRAKNAYGTGVSSVQVHGRRAQDMFTLDTDGDGISDGQELLDGSNPNDKGSGQEILGNTVCADWNGFFGMWNVMEHINMGNDTISVTNPFRGISFDFDSGDQVDVLIHDAAERGRDRTGKTCSTHDGNAGDLNGGMVYYQPSANGEGFDFAFAMPFLKGKKGSQFVPFNTFQLTPGNSVANWVQLSNLSSEPQSGEMITYGMDGSIIDQRTINLAAEARFDYAAHGVGVSKVGMVEWRPNNTDVFFEMRIVRYYYDNPYQFSTFSTAMQLDARIGTGEAQAVALDNVSSLAILEVSNTLSESVTAEVEFFTADGTFIKQESFQLAAYATTHIITNTEDKLPAQLGNARITANKAASLAVTAMHYGREGNTPTGALNYVYGLQAGEAIGQVIRGTYNTFLSQGCDLILTNPTDSAADANITMSRPGATDEFPGLVGHIETVPANGVVQLDLCSNDEANRYGVVTVQTDAPSLIGTVVRIGENDDYRFSTPLRR